MDTTKDNTNDVASIVDLASSIKPIEIASNEYIKRIATPQGWQLRETNDEHLLPIPSRKKGSVHLESQDSFIQYINRHKLPESTTIYCEADYTRSIVRFNCIINDHTSTQDGQQWRDHKAIFEPNLSKEWETWKRNNRQPLTQTDMAFFIEENLQDIVAAEGFPTGQQLLEMATSFQANQDMRFKSAIRLQNGGVNMSFVQDDDTATLAQMKLFERIAIGIPVFRNGDAYQITARLRYRVKDGKLTFWYELIREDKVIEDATTNLINKIKNETEVHFYHGHI